MVGGYVQKILVIVIKSYITFLKEVSIRMAKGKEFMIIKTVLILRMVPISTYFLEDTTVMD